MGNKVHKLAFGLIVAFLTVSVSGTLEAATKKPVNMTPIKTSYLNVSKTGACHDEARYACGIACVPECPPGSYHAIFVRCMLRK
jgi:hypothetical protein